MLFNAHGILKDQRAVEEYRRAIYGCLYWNEINDLNKSLAVISASAFAKVSREWRKGHAPG